MNKLLNFKEYKDNNINNNNVNPPSVNESMMKFTNDGFVDNIPNKMLKEVSNYNDYYMIGVDVLSDLEDEQLQRNENEKRQKEYDKFLREKESQRIRQINRMHDRVGTSIGGSNLVKYDDFGSDFSSDFG